jgi:hypothetical protein
VSFFYEAPEGIKFLFSVYEPILELVELLSGLLASRRPGGFAYEYCLVLCKSYFHRGSSRRSHQRPCSLATAASFCRRIARESGVQVSSLTC